MLVSVAFNINEHSTDEGHSPETSGHLLRFWHFQQHSQLLVSILAGQNQRRIQHLTDKLKECQDEQSLKSPRKCTHYNSQSNEEHQQRKWPRQETNDSLNEKIQKSKSQSLS